MTEPNFELEVASMFLVADLESDESFIRNIEVAEAQAHLFASQALIREIARGPIKWAQERYGEA